MPVKLTKDSSAAVASRDPLAAYATSVDGERDAGARTMPSKKLTRLVAPGVRAPVQILLVEDDVAAREALALLLADEGASVSEATDAQAALAILDALRPDAVIIDIHLPGMNGHDLVRHVRARPNLRTLPAIALTGMATVTDRITALSAGFTTHMTKPVDPDALISTVAHLTGVAGATP